MRCTQINRRAQRVVATLLVADPSVVTISGLLAQVTAAKGSIADAGGTADTLAISATALTAEDSQPGTTGDLVHDGGFAAAMG
jgi:hypothetical protein